LQQAGVNQHSPAEVKVALFRSLFHGREDVYPRRFESRKTGRAGYAVLLQPRFTRRRGAPRILAGDRKRREIHATAQCPVSIAARAT
jgi:hypothetical protein